MKDEGGAVLAVTGEGAKTGCDIVESLKGFSLYIPERLRGCIDCRKSEVFYYEDWHGIVKELFNTNKYLVFICAVGIVVRSISPILKNKYEDPGVVVMDDQGENVISLISGHLGGANNLAREVAEISGGRAVITTATDCRNMKYPPDLFAHYVGGFCEPLGLIKKFNRLIAEGYTLNLYSSFNLAVKIKDEYNWQGCADEGEIKEPAVVISPYIIDNASKEILLIKPRCLVVGIGCVKDVPLESVKMAVEKVFRYYKLDKRCIKALATIDFKGEEEALKAYGRELDVPLIRCSGEEIESLKGTYQGSSRVKKEVGVDGVCEPAARLAAGMGITLVPKVKAKRVAISVALEKSWWLDWDREIGSC